MIRSLRLKSILRCLVPMSVLFLVLGHACELPAFVGLASHPAGNAHHSTDEQADVNLTSCDAAVAARSNTGCLQAGPILDVVQALQVAQLVPVHPVTSSREDSRIWLSRPPLFLLHASLLI